MAEEKVYALSIRQPWATLVVLGLKTIEIRRWATRRRGPVLIHAAQILDPRPQGWDRLPPSAKNLAELRGGILGQAEVASCISYRRPEDFIRDCPLHCNDPSWFVGPTMYGFSFLQPQIVPFQKYPGNLRFFSVDPKRCQDPFFGKKKGPDTFSDR